MAEWTIRGDFLDSDRRVGAGPARTGAQRRASANLLASVLLGFAALLAVPQAAHAVDKDIWSATLTTAASSTATTVFGYADYTNSLPADSFGSLSADSVSDLGATRSVNPLYNDNASGGTLTFGVEGTGTNRLSDADFRARLTLHIGMTDSFAASAATYDDQHYPYDYTFTWTSTGLTWSAAQSIAVRLTLDVPGIDSIAFNSAGPDNTFYLGDAVTATVTFDEAVYVDTTGGTPQLTIKVGSSDEVLSYSLGYRHGGARVHRIHGGLRGHGHRRPLHRGGQARASMAARSRPPRTNIRTPSSPTPRWPPPRATRCPVWRSRWCRRP